MSYYGTHNRLARIALEKVENDNYLNGLDRTQVNITEKTQICIKNSNLLLFSGIKSRI